MKVAVHHKTQTVTSMQEVKKMVPVTTLQEVTELVEVTKPVSLGDIQVYAVQYRNYPLNTIHIQHRGEPDNRFYGFACDIPGQAADDVSNRQLSSLAGTEAMYAPGALVVNGIAAYLIGVDDITYNVPLSTLPF